MQRPAKQIAEQIACSSTLLERVIQIGEKPSLDNGERFDLFEAWRKRYLCETWWKRQLREDAGDIFGPRMSQLLLQYGYDSDFALDDSAIDDDHPEVTSPPSAVRALPKGHFLAFSIEAIHALKGDLNDLHARLVESYVPSPIVFPTPTPTTLSSSSSYSVASSSSSTSCSSSSSHSASASSSSSSSSALLASLLADAPWNHLGPGTSPREYTVPRSSTATTAISTLASSVAPVMMDPRSRNAAMRLNEYCAKRKWGITYTFAEHGPPHMPAFHCRAVIRPQSGGPTTSVLHQHTGAGTTRKAARIAAASHLISALAAENCIVPP